MVWVFYRLQRNTPSIEVYSTVEGSEWKAFNLLSAVFTRLWYISPNSWTCWKTPRLFPRSQQFCSGHVAVLSLALHTMGTRGIHQAHPMLFQIARALTMSLLKTTIYIPTLSLKLLWGVNKLFSGHFAQREIHSLVVPLPKRKADSVTAKQSSGRRGNKRKDGGLTNEDKSMKLSGDNQCQLTKWAVGISWEPALPH